MSHRAEVLSVQHAKGLTVALPANGATTPLRLTGVLPGLYQGRWLARVSESRLQVVWLLSLSILASSTWAPRLYNTR